MLLALHLLVLANASAQEFIPNGDFEQGGCPPSYSGINGGYCNSWHCVAGSPDYFNCDFYGTIFSATPSTGTGVVGFLALPNNLFCAGQLQRESFAATLITPLEPCRAYRITCDLRLAALGSAVQSSGYGSACVDLGFYFYNGGDPNPCWNSCGCWTEQPQVRISASAVPYLQYETITVDFVPQAAYTKVAIGPVCTDTMFTPSCITPPENQGPFHHYFNLDNLSMTPAEDIIVEVSEGTICQNGTVTVGGTSLAPVLAWNWSIPGAVPLTNTDTSASFLFPATGSHAVHLQLSTPCGTRDMGVVDSIIVHPTYPDVEVQPMLLSCESTPFTVDDPWPGLVYQWSDGVVGPSRRFERSGTFRVTATDEYGCHLSADNMQTELLGSVRFSPNPTRESWSSDLIPIGPCRAVLFDMLGNRALEMELSDRLELKARSLGLANGMYVLRLELGDCVSDQKLILSD